MNTPTPPAPTGTEIDDIMSSIRESVATESTKVGQGNDDLLNAAAAAADDDVLELTPAELATPVATPAAATVDTADILGVPTLSPADEAADEFDKLLAEIGQEKQQRAAEVQAQKEALLADVEPLGTESMPTPALADEEARTALNEAPVTEPVAATPVVAPAASTSATHTVGMLPGSDGLQLVLPAEVLAIALRPMVQGWLDANLPKVVEQLVQAEIAKLNQ